MLYSGKLTSAEQQQQQHQGEEVKFIAYHTRGHTILKFFRNVTPIHKLEVPEKRGVIEKTTPKMPGYSRIILGVHVAADLPKFHPSIHSAGGRNRARHAEIFQDNVDFLSNLKLFNHARNSEIH